MNVYFSAVSISDCSLLLHCWKNIPKERFSEPKQRWIPLFHMVLFSGVSWKHVPREGSRFRAQMRQGIKLWVHTCTHSVWVLHKRQFTSGLQGSWHTRKTVFGRQNIEYYSIAETQRNTDINNETQQLNGSSNCQRSLRSHKHFQKEP